MEARLERVRRPAYSVNDTVITRKQLSRQHTLTREPFVFCCLLSKNGIAALEAKCRMEIKLHRSDCNIRTDNLLNTRNAVVAKACAKLNGSASLFFDQALRNDFRLTVCRAAIHVQINGFGAT